MYPRELEGWRSLIAMEPRMSYRGLAEDPDKNLWYDGGGQEGVKNLLLTHLLTGCVSFPGKLELVSANH